MVGYSLKRIILVILPIFFFAECKKYNLLEDGYPFYENYFQGTIRIPEKMLSHSAFFYTDTLIVSEVSLQYGQHESIVGESFNTLLNIKMINGWNSFKDLERNVYPKDYEDFITKRKQELELFYLGNLNLSKRYSSYLILVSDIMDDYNIVLKVFLVNVNDNKVVSVTRMSQYTCFDGDIKYIYTDLSEKGVFIQRSKLLESDVIIPEEYQQEEHEKIIFKFTYNRNGFVTLLK